MIKLNETVLKFCRHKLSNLPFNTLKVRSLDDNMKNHLDCLNFVDIFYDSISMPMTIYTGLNILYLKTPNHQHLKKKKLTIRT